MRRWLQSPRVRSSADTGQGFTLLELMVAIAIFAILGLMSSQMLNNMIRQNGIIDQRGERLIGLQRAMTIMQRDISQIWNRPIRDAYGENPLPAISSGDEWPIEFTRTGWRNPLGHQRSELQRVAYDHRDKTLYRIYWNVLDRAIDTEPLEQVLLEDVLSVEFESLDGYGDAWQPGSAVGSPDPLLALAAISVRLDLEGYGEITRLWEVAIDLNNAIGRGPGQSAAPGTELDGSDELLGPATRGSRANGGGSNRERDRNDRQGNPRAAPVIGDQTR